MRFVDPLGLLVIGIRGYAPGSSGGGENQVSGVDTIAQMLRATGRTDEVMVVDTQTDNSKWKEIVDRVKQCPDKEPVLLYGHSWGVRNTLELEADLRRDGIKVKAIAGIDWIGAGATLRAPAGVPMLYYYQTNDGPRQGQAIFGAKNIHRNTGADGSQLLHTTIDDDTGIQTEILRFLNQWKPSK